MILKPQGLNYSLGASDSSTKTVIRRSLPLGEDKTHEYTYFDLFIADGELSSGNFRGFLIHTGSGRMFVMPDSFHTNKEKTGILPVASLLEQAIQPIFQFKKVTT